MESGDQAWRRGDEVGKRNGSGVVIEYVKSSVDLLEVLAFSWLFGQEMGVVKFGGSGRLYEFGTLGHWLDIEIRRGDL